MIIHTSLDINKNGLVIQLYKDSKQIAIGGGFLKYEFGSMYLNLKSMCEPGMNADSEKYKAVSPSNTADSEGNENLKWKRYQLTAIESPRKQRKTFQFTGAQLQW